MKITSFKNTVILLVITLLFSLLLRSTNLFIISASICILYKLLAPLVSKKIFDSKIITFVLVFFTYFILLQCAVLLSWLINNNFPLDYTPALLFAPLIITFLYKLFRYKTNDENLKLINYKDIVALSISLFVCAFILIAPMREASGSPIVPTISVSLANGNVDDAAHIALINDRLQFNRGIIQGSDADGKTRSQGFYPAGWHSISAIIIKSVFPNIKTGTESLIAYSIQKLFWFFVLFYLFIRTCLGLCKIVTDKKNKNISIFFMAALSMFFGCVFLMSIMGEGFYSFIPQLIAALFTLLLLAQIFDDKGKEAVQKSLPLLLLSCIGGCLSWFLPFPAFGLALVIVIVNSTFDKRLFKFIKNLGSIILKNLAILALLAGALATQLFVMFTNHTSESVSLLKGLSLEGGITKYTDQFYIFVFLGFVAFMFLCGKKVFEKLHIFLSLIASLLPYCILIYIIQMATVGNTVYYFFKTLNILTIIALPISIIGFAKLTQKLFDINHIAMGVTVTFVIMSGLFLFVKPSVSTFAYPGGHRDLDSNIDNSVFVELETDLNESKYFDNRIVLYYTPGQVVRNELTNMLAKSNMPASTCFERVRRSMWKTPTIGTILEDTKRYCNGINIIFVTDKGYYVEFAQDVINMGLQKMISVKYY